MLHILDNNYTVCYLLLFFINFTATKFSLSAIVLLTRLIITGRLISEKLNNSFVEKHCFTIHKFVDLFNIYQLIFVKKKNFPRLECLSSF